MIPVAFASAPAMRDVGEILTEAFFHEPQPELKSFLDDLERRLILVVLDRVGGNQKEAARILGVKYTTLNDKVKRFGIQFEKRIVEAEPDAEAAAAWTV